MEWLRKNITGSTIIILISIAVGAISTNAVKLYSNTLTEKKVAQHTAEIELNSDFRKAGHPFTATEAMKLEKAYMVAIDENINMTYEQKIKAFVPRSEFDDMKENVRDIKEGQVAIMKLLLDRLPK